MYIYMYICVCICVCKARNARGGLAGAPPNRWLKDCRASGWARSAHMRPGYTKTVGMAEQSGEAINASQPRIMCHDLCVCVPKQMRLHQRYTYIS